MTITFGCIEVEVQVEHLRLLLLLGRDLEHMDAVSSSSKGVMENVEQPHVLAVDDSLIDRKLIEKLLINSSCKGNIYSCNRFLFFFTLSSFLFGMQ